MTTSPSSHIGPETTIERDFRKFDAANPQVYTELVRLARLWKERRGVERLGIATLYEVARWQIAMRTSGDPFKLNNNYRALYARKIMATEDDLKGMFETRRLRGADPYVEPTPPPPPPPSLPVEEQPQEQLTWG